MPFPRSVLAAGLLTTLLAGEAQAAPGAGVRIVHRFAAPPQTSDVRWSARGPEVLLSHLVDGAAVHQLAPGLPRVRTLFPAGEQLRGAQFLHLAADGESVVVADRDGGFFARPWRAEGPFALAAPSMALTAGLDLRGGRLLLVGAGPVGPDGDFDREGALAWIGAPDRPGAVKPLLVPSPAVAGVPDLTRCLFAEAAAARILSDGRLLVAPLAAPRAVYLYSASGALLESWSFDELGLDNPCPPAGDMKLVRDRKIRDGWRNGRRLVDAAVEIDGQPALVVRTSSANGTRWVLRSLTPGLPTQPLPLTGQRNERLRADARSAGSGHTELLLLRRPSFLTSATATTATALFVVDVHH